MHAYLCDERARPPPTVLGSMAGVGLSDMRPDDDAAAGAEIQPPNADPLAEHFSEKPTLPHVNRLHRIDRKLTAFGMSPEQVTRTLSFKQQHVEDTLRVWPRWRVACYLVASHRLFKAASIVVILINSILIAAVVNCPPGEVHAAEVLTHVSSFVFAFELLVRAVGSTRVPWWRSGWLIIDFTVVVVDFLELVIMPLLLLIFEDEDMRILSTVQMLRLVRLLRLGKLLKFMQPLRVILRAIVGAGWIVMSAGIYVGLLWLMFAIFFTTYLGNNLDDSDPRLREAQRYFSTIPQSMLVQLECTLGGLQWGVAIVEPLIDASGAGWKWGGVTVLIAMFLSTFWLWNLVLGIYVKQITGITGSYEHETEQKALYEGECNVQQLRAVLDSIDTDGDGYISKMEFHLGLLHDKDVLKKIGVAESEVAMLFSALDTDGKGQVPIGEFLFGVLKLVGSSKTIDVLSIDYRQKVLLRDVTILEANTQLRVDKITNALDLVFSAATQLESDMRALHGTVAKALELLGSEIAWEKKHSERYKRRQEYELKMQLDMQNKKARRRIEEQLESLRSQVDELSQRRQLGFLCSGDRGSSRMPPGEGGNLAALRQAVRERLESELLPWLERELAPVTV